MRILLADDHALFRDGLRSLLVQHGFEIVGEARDGREAVDLTRRLRPDVVLMDLRMPEITPPWRARCWASFVVRHQHRDRQNLRPG